MLREVGNLYSRSFRMIFQHPQFLLVTVAYLIYTNLDRYSDALLRSSNSIGLYVSVGWIKFPINFCVSTGFPLALLLMSNQLDSGINLKSVFQKTKEYFWRFFRQNLAGIFLSFAYALPIIFVVLFSLFMADAIFLAIVVSLFFVLVIGYLAFGSLIMGERILLDDGNGAFQNSLRGLRLINGNFPFFATLFFITTLISIALFPIRYALGSYITGIDLFAIPVSDFQSFMKNVYSATQTPIVYAWDFLYGIIFLPFYTILFTLAYQRVKESKDATHPHNRSLKTDH